MRHALLALALGALAFVAACDVNDYCLNCATNDATGTGDDGGAPDAIRDAGAMPDACIINGAEVCDGLDNDCNGTADDNIPTVGDTCGAAVGVCTVGVIECHGADGLVCSGDALQGPEQCDNLDNDCDTVVDDNNPEGGERCGTDIGDCIAGFTQCIPGGVLDCVGDVGTVNGQPEMCDGRDNDCDGNFDEGLPSMGSCGATEDGDCEFGTLECVGGGPQCVGYIGPTFEACDLPMGGNPAHDSDCDGMDHNGYDLDHDVRNCGACQTSCVGTIDNATAACNLACVGGTNDGRACTSGANCPGGTCGGGDCVVGNCNAGYWDNLPGGPGDPNEGCEYGPCTFAGPQEDCNFRDDNCNGQVDEALTPPSLCLTTGACAAVTASCFHDAVAVPATSYWECDYSTADVSLDPMGNIIQESQCDGVDNDCDGRIDEGDPQVFNRTTCNDAAAGVCQKFGHMVCDPSDQDAAPICSLNLAVPIVDSGGGSPVAETCDGKDNDCDGLTDDNSMTIMTITRASNVVTATTSAPHTLTVGTTVVIAGVADTTFNNTLAIPTFTVVSTPTATTFTYAQTAGNASSTGGTANATNAASRNVLQNWVSIGGGVSVMAYEASRPDASNPDPSLISPPLTSNISSIIRAGNVVTVTTATAHNLAVGNSVVIAGVTNTTFNNTWTVTSTPTTTKFTFDQVLGNASSSGGTATRPVPAGFPLGLITTYPCSRAGVTPWVNVKQPDADAACAAVGGRLCSEQEWHRACAARTGTTYPVAEPGTVAITAIIRTSNVVTVTTAGHSFAVGDGIVIAGVTPVAFNGTNFTITGVTATTFTYAQTAANGSGTAFGTAGNGKMVFEVEDYATLTPNTTLDASEFPAGSTGRLHTWVPDYSTGYSGISALRASPNNSNPAVANTGANVAAAQAPAESPRLDFPVTISTTGLHFVWVKMWSPGGNNNNDNEIHVGISTAPATTAPTQVVSTSTTNAWQWRISGGITVAATGAATVSLYMKEDGARIDEILVTRSNSATLPTALTTNGNDWTFGDVYATTTCNGQDNDGDVPPANAGDQDDVIQTGAKAACFAEWGAQDVFDMSGNVKEWTKERFPASNPLRGGASNNEQQGMTCSNAFTLANDTFFFNNVGFRCCK